MERKRAFAMLGFVAIGVGLMIPSIFFGLQGFASGLATTIFAMLGFVSFELMCEAGKPAPPSSEKGGG